MSDKVKGFISNGSLAEFHLMEIIQLSAADTLSPWLTTQQAWEALAEKAVNDRLKSLGWIQQRIAKAKNVSQQLVSERIRLHSMPTNAKRFTTDRKITEENLREIARLQLSSKLSPWLTTQQVWQELAQDLKIFKMGLLGIPQERIAQRLRIPQQTIADHLPKNLGLKKSVNELLTKGFSVNTIAEKLEWPEPFPDRHR